MSEARANGSGGRPLSPHMQVWRWHITMLGSILHRATGVALYAGALIAAGWAASLAAGPDAYQGYCGLLGSPPLKCSVTVSSCSVPTSPARNVRSARSPGHRPWAAAT